MKLKLNDVTVLADSLNTKTGDRATTFLLERFPLRVLAEINTHRVFSRNAGSTRAIPVGKVIEQVINDPYIPDWTRKQPGMQGARDLASGKRDKATQRSLEARDYQIEVVRELHENWDIAKQDCNWYLAPWMRLPYIVTSTTFGNFFKLRVNEKTVHPALYGYAKDMRELFHESVPQFIEPGDWHIAFGDMGLEDMSLQEKLKISAARAARGSYNDHFGDFKPERDYKLHDDLLREGHMSPFEHQLKAQEQKRMYRNLQGFMHYRQHVEERVAIS